MTALPSGFKGIGKTPIVEEIRGELFFGGERVYRIDDCEDLVLRAGSKAVAFYKNEPVFDSRDFEWRDEDFDWRHDVLDD